MMSRKGRYFSVRFSALLLERLEAARVELYGERTSLAETVRRLIEERLNEVTGRVALNGTVSAECAHSSYPAKDAAAIAHLLHLNSSECLLAEEITEVAMAVQKLVQRGLLLGEKERSPN